VHRSCLLADNHHVALVTVKKTPAVEGVLQETTLHGCQLYNPASRCARRCSARPGYSQGLVTLLQHDTQQ
jgi:hypothetical protein